MKNLTKLMFVDFVRKQYIPMRLEIIVTWQVNTEAPQITNVI